MFYSCHLPSLPAFFFFFFFNDTATTEIYTLSLHDALPILMAFISPISIFSLLPFAMRLQASAIFLHICRPVRSGLSDRKSTRLNSSHLGISYAVFCLKKKKGSEAADHCAIRCGDIAVRGRD